MDEEKKKNYRPPHNPGLSEKAWDDLHLFIARMQIKHGKKLAEQEKTSVQPIQRAFN